MSTRQPEPPRRIRATHHYGFRAGEWATILGRGVQIMTHEPPSSGWVTPEPYLVEREVYVVQFDDGVIDTWPVEDPSDSYEFA